LRTFIQPHGIPEVLANTAPGVLESAVRIDIFFSSNPLTTALYHARSEKVT